MYRSRLGLLDRGARYSVAQHPLLPQSAPPPASYPAGIGARLFLSTLRVCTLRGAPAGVGALHACPGQLPSPPNAAVISAIARCSASLTFWPPSRWAAA